MFLQSYVLAPREKRHTQLEARYKATIEGYSQANDGLENALNQKDGQEDGLMDGPIEICTSGRTTSSRMGTCISASGELLL